MKAAQAWYTKIKRLLFPEAYNTTRPIRSKATLWLKIWQIQLNLDNVDIL